MNYGQEIQSTLTYQIRTVFEGFALALLFHFLLPPKQTSVYYIQEPLEGAKTAKAIGRINEQALQERQTGRLR